MKTMEDIKHARMVVATNIQTLKTTSPRNLREEQILTLLSGMSVALCWVAEEGGTTLQRLVDGEPIRDIG